MSRMLCGKLWSILRPYQACAVNFSKYEKFQSLHLSKVSNLKIIQLRKINTSIRILSNTNNNIGKASTSFEEKLKEQEEKLILDQQNTASTTTRLDRVWKGEDESLPLNDGEDLNFSVVKNIPKNSSEFTVEKKKISFEDEDFVPKKKYESSINRSSSNYNFDFDETTDYTSSGENRERRRYRSIKFGEDCEDWENRRPRGHENIYQKREIPSLREFVQLPPLEKDFFKPSTSLIERSSSINEEYLKKNKIVVEGSKIPPPIQKFSDFQFSESVLSSLNEFDAPTAIQAMGWSVALSGKDLIGIGQTGSGKTLGYILPGLIHVSHQRDILEREGLNNNDSPIGLVLAPTRELVQQIMQVYMKYCRGFRIRGTAMFGGASRNRQLENLRFNPKFLVATPGRLIDFINSGQVSLDKCSYIVLDEADRMLDMGFEPQIQSIMQHIRPDRKQTLMWSATWPSEVKELATQFLNDPVQITVGSTKLSANPDVKQNVFVCDDKEKFSMLEDLLKTMIETNRSNQAIVFCQTKKAADFITRNLTKYDINAEAIHGDKSQSMRDRALNGFRKNKFNVLVATEVAARGLDIPVLKCVVNFDFPTDTESYVHRIGRTGRCGNKGLAYTFFTEEDAPRAAQLIDIMEEAGQKVPQSLLDLAENYQSGILSNKKMKRSNKHKNFSSFKNRGRGGPNTFGRGAKW